MNKPHLVILKEIVGTPVQGGCSSCKGVVFETGSGIGFPPEHKQKLEKLFREHFRAVHENARAISVPLTPN